MSESLAQSDYEAEEHAVGPAGPGEDNSRLMTIGEIATVVGITSAAIRFYEERGLVAPRRLGRLRVYGPADIARLRTVMAYRRMGLPVSRIAAALKAAEAYQPSERKRAAAMLADHLRQLEGRLRGLQGDICRTSTAITGVLTVSSGVKIH